MRACSIGNSKLKMCSKRKTLPLLCAHINIINVAELEGLSSKVICGG